LAHDAELAWLHVLNLSDSVEQLSAVRMFHARSICIYIYLCYKKGAWKVIFLNGVLRPCTWDLAPMSVASEKDERNVRPHWPSKP
jgi:hypothetical protein